MDAQDAPAAAVAARDDRPWDADVSACIEVLLLDVGGVLVPFPDPMAVARLERELALAAGGLRALLYEGEP